MRRFEWKPKWLLAATVLALASFGTLHATEPTPSPQELQGIQRSKDAFVRGQHGPVVSCWNTQWANNNLDNWNLKRQVQWIKEGHGYGVSIYCPLSSQGANSATKWNNFKTMFAEELAWINANGIPVTLRWHNWLNEIIDESPRTPWPDSGLVHFLDGAGELEDAAIVDPLGPIAPWTKMGEGLANSLWIDSLAAELPNCPRFYWLENNEASMGALGQYTVQLSGPKDAWGFKPRAWKTGLLQISLRAEDYRLTGATPAQLAIDIPRKWREKREASQAAILANAPASMQGKIYFGGYGDLGKLGESGLLGQTYSYENPAVDWNFMRWDVAIHTFTDPSERCYDDGSGSPFNWHDWVRGPHIFQHNFLPMLAEMRANRPLYHDDMSWWISPQRCRMAATDHGGYVLPTRARGFARASLWSTRPEVFRFFASSQEKLTNQWFDAAGDPVEYQSLTVADYWNVAMESCDEVWDNPTLLKFWRDGVPVLNPDPHFCKWVLPPEVPDTRSLTLYTDADAPRYVNGQDTWRNLDGKVELKVFAQAYQIEDPAFGTQTLVFAWSPRETRTNVTVQVPGVGGVLFTEVDQDGEWRLTSGGLAIH